MNLMNFEQPHENPRRSKAFKPGLKNLNGRNFDTSMDRPIEKRQLQLSDFSMVGTKNNRPGNYTVLQPQNRERFYNDQRKVFRPESNYSQTADVIRLGGL